MHKASRLFSWITGTQGNDIQTDETLGITVKAKVSPEATNFITQVLAYGGSSCLKNMN
jgi:hypothetical protein